jgi:GTP cyclohydrolase II
MKARDAIDSQPPFHVVTERAPIADVARVAEAVLPTRHGEFRIAVFQVAGVEIAALFFGTSRDGSIPLVRLHSECLTGDTFGSLRCDCGEQLDAALAGIAASGYGILLYLHQEGRGIGLANKIRAYALQDGGMDTVDANVALGLPVDSRDYRAAAAVLGSLGLSRVRLLTNNPSKYTALERCGIQVLERVALITRPNASNVSYLHTKADRMGHLLHLRGEADGLDDEL